MNKLLLSILFCCLACFVHAQNSSDAVKDINRIKSDSLYLSAESTVRDWETALDNAKVLLSREIEDWLTEKGYKDVSGVIASLQEHILEIKTTRASLYRAFVYVKKSDILSYTDKSKLLVVDIEKKTTVKPRQEEPVHVLYSPTAEEKEMLEIVNSIDIEKYIKEKQRNGVISTYGKYANLPTAGLIYLFIYNKEGKVPACLKMENGKTINIATGKQEVISQVYKGCGAIWFQTKK